VRRRPNTTVLVLLAYVAIAFLYFGIRLVHHPGREVVGAPLASDFDIFIWCFAWWPHAILHGLNPFVSHVVYAPTGTNLAWVTSVPLLAIVFSPFTLIFGPDVGYNVAAVLLPALAAWTAFLLCRYLTRSTWAAIVGGYLYGFSSYMLSHEYAGHLNLVAVFLVPLVALVVLRYLRGELSRRGLVWRLGVLIAAQLYTSTEVAVTLTLALVLASLLGLWLVRDARKRIRASVVPIVLGYGVALVLAAPLVYYALTGFSRATVYASFYDIDLLNLFVPTQVTGLGGQSFASFTGHFPGGIPERSMYVGLPIMVIVVLLVWLRRRPSTWFLLAGFGVATILSFGTALYFHGHRIVWLPWSALGNMTGLSDVVPSRFSDYAWLALAAMIAIWIAGSRGRVAAVVLPLLAVLFLIPPVWRHDSVNTPPRLAFFSDHFYKVCIPKGETLMVFPFARWGYSMLWQAESNFWFNITEGTLGHNNQPANFVSDPTVYALIMESEDPTQRPNMAQILALAKRRSVDRIVSAVAGGDAYPSGVQMHAFGPLQVIGDAYVAPACGYNSLAGDKRPPPTG
jgi:hypothetical protein